jgi:putative membrane protein
MIFYIVALLLGILAGIITGIFPGIHINLVAVILLGSLASFPFLQYFPLITLVIFIVSMSITHSFLDFIPSIYLGAPDEDSFLSVLPGHQLLKKGLGHQAVVLTLYGSLIALPIILIFIPVFLYVLPLIFSISKSIIPFILIFASLYLILREDKFLIPLTVFILAGFLGFLSLNLPIEQPLLPLLTGLFGLSSLFVSLKNKTTIPKQIVSPLKKIKLPKNFIKTSIAALISAPLCSFLPGIGSGHAAVIGSEITKQDNKSFLFLVGAINTIVIALSFITLYSIGKSRSGVAAAVKSLITALSLTDLAIIISTIFISGVLAFFIGIKISKLSSSYLNKINYRFLSIAVILILLAVNLYFTNLLGFLILITASALGVFTILSGSKRINLMGSLLIPTIIFYLII